MRYLSVCSGIEAATVAWQPLGWTPYAFAEIEKFPSAVLAHHYPSIPNLGDITRFKDWPDATFDVLVGGTPCQSFSIAGLRKGLDDPRGNLALTYCAILDRYRPRWFVWENVPGVLSSDGGRAFGSILGAMGELRYGWAYRVIDAQYVRVDGFGRAVPQRRRRVFVVGHLGDWRRAAEVLFEPESLSGNPAPRREAGERVAPTISARPTGGGGLGTDFDCDGGLIAAPVAATLNAHYGSKWGLEDQHVNQGCPMYVARPFSITPSNSNKDYNARPADKSQAVTGNGNRPSARGGDLIAFSCKDYAADAGPIAPTLRSMGHDGSHANAGGQIAVTAQQGVRRLTPRECERLQGFEDDYTNVPWRGKPTSPDGPRYKALGNSKAINAVRWIGTRIQMVEVLS